MPVSIAHPVPRPGTARTGLSVRAGVVDDIEREDDAKGYEPEARFHKLVKDLVADGDRRARKASRPARRTLGQMVPGHQRCELLTLVGAGSARGE
ncbi:hypothetical protein ACFVP0_23585 [Streptomyces cinereoruber]|uniref:hypothetical protein n=1 Tax=Streptomyces cinereoruber TaxID=67260 RepID=UPI00369F4624